jgi:transcriptional regulator with XRE-family HTH domain
MAAEHARVEALRRHLGAQLATYRTAAVVSQPQLGQALGRTRSTVSKIEHGRRGMPAQLWTIADDLCGAAGALVAEYEALAAAERDYRDRCRTQRRQMQIQAGAQARRQALPAWPEPGSVPGVLGGGGGDAWPDKALVSAGLAEELTQVVTRLVQMLGRREAIRTLGSVLAAVGLSSVDPDEHTRLAHAVASPSRVDTHVITNLAAALAYCKRLEDTLGPSEVMETVTAQHHLVRRLLAGDCPDRFRPALSVVDSNMASAIGGYLIDMGDHHLAQRYFHRARRAGHDARNPACAAYAAANMTLAAFLLGDVPTALDNAAAARSLAARTHDPRLQALTEHMAAAAYAIDGQHGPCMAASARAHDLLTTANGSAPESPAYWVHHGTIDSQRSLFLCLLGKPHHAVDAAINARTRYPSSVRRIGLAHGEIRLSHALVLTKDITDAARVLGDAASHAHLFPRLTHELHATRAMMQPWNHTPAVTTLDTQLQTYGLLPTTTPRPETHPNRRT